ncbi:hypothetical protein [Deefgea piscis]|uniref:hypothetical protein n=1 Tax=Deefgea piscis TaxID=2739061 RepID=UPI001C801CA5|nr:hypothetical protein [Deefgea piscis]QZA79664.1 hypothetical protein K4H25_08800 [Deefgea piscis]
MLVNIQCASTAIFDWFKQENQELRYKIAQDFTIKKFTEQTQSIFYTLQPISFCNHDDLLAYMDSRSLSLDEKKHWLDGVKKLYHQQQYRKNLKGKKQYNFILPESTIAKLDGLAIQYSLSRAEIIELLIKMEATKPTHLPERLRYVMQMTL